MKTVIEAEVARDFLTRVQADQPFYIPGGGVWQREDRKPFNTRQIELTPLVVEGDLSAGRVFLPHGLVLVDAEAKVPLTGSRVRITIEVLDD